MGTVTCAADLIRLALAPESKLICTSLLIWGSRSSLSR
jgi:hypothetical protein